MPYGMVSLKSYNRTRQCVDFLFSTILRPDVSEKLQQSVIGDLLNSDDGHSAFLQGIDTDARWGCSQFCDLPHRQHR
ncbi:MAG: hypothetical protein R3B90_09680 [Planctomycetaceae bacterium]